MMPYTGTLSSTPVNKEAVCETTCVPGLPPLNTVMVKTGEVLSDCNALADKLIEILANASEKKEQEAPSPRSLIEFQIANADLACALLHKLEQALSFIGN